MGIGIVAVADEAASSPDVLPYRPLSTVVGIRPSAVFPVDPALKDIAMLHRFGALRFLLVVATASIALLAVAQNGAFAPPPSGPVTDTFFGTAVEDPYRNFENKDDPAVAAWMKAENERARATLDRITRARGAAAGDHPVRRRNHRARGERSWVRASAGSANAATPMRTSSSCSSATGWAAPTGCWSIPKLSRSRPASRTPSTGSGHHRRPPRRRRRPVRTGSEAATMHLLKTGQRAGDRRADHRADYGGVDFARDGRTFAVNRLQEMKPGMAEIEIPAQPGVAAQGRRA